MKLVKGIRETSSMMYLGNSVNNGGQKPVFICEVVSVTATLRVLLALQPVYFRYHP